MSGKSVMEMVWGTLLVICITFIGGLVLLCFWGMCSRDFLKFLCYAVIVMVLGLPLIDWCASALADAEQTRKDREITAQRNSEMNMYFGGNTYYNANGKTVQVVSDEEYLKLKKENEALKLKARLADLASQNMEVELATMKRKHQNECRQYSRLLEAARADVKAQQKAYREQREIDHLEHMELRAWRKTEKARKKRSDKLRSRVRKIRRRKKIDGLIVAVHDLAVASNTATECNIPLHRLEISNAIIALAEYLQPYNPSEELKIYLWDCRTVEALLNDIRESIVTTAFGKDWEKRILAGLIGLNVIEPSITLRAKRLLKAV